jgi:hypothetical protein
MRICAYLKLEAAKRNKNASGITEEIVGWMENQEDVELAL